MEQQLHQQYIDALSQIESYSGATAGWADAYKLIQEGKAMASGQWKLQIEPQGNLLIGNLTSGGQYGWIEPIYIPPILLDLQWHEVEKSEH